MSQIRGNQISGSVATASYIDPTFISASAAASGFGSGGGGTGAGFPFTGSAQITGSLTVTGSVNATSFSGDGSGLTNLPIQYGLVYAVANGNYLT